MKHIHETWYLLVKLGILWMSVYIFMSMEARMSFFERVTREFILRMRSLGQNGPLRQITISAVARIDSANY